MNRLLNPVIQPSETYTLEDDPIDEFHVSLPTPAILQDESGSYYDEEDLTEIPTEAGRVHVIVLETLKYLRWIRNAKPGASRVYHIGNLLVDRESDKQADLIGHLFMRAADHGLVLLVQRRSPKSEGPCPYSAYYAYRTSKDLTPFHLRDLQTIIEEFENAHL